MLYWPLEQTLVVADLHLEKASYFASRGVMLPPYDTAATLAALAEGIEFYRPRRIIALGDNFHDRDGGNRVSPETQEILFSLQRGREWIWITGNHDPEHFSGVGGHFAPSLQVRAIYLRHQPLSIDSIMAENTHEIIGHLHPVVRVGRRVLRRKCFAGTSCRLILPAFGSLTGGLNIRNPVFQKVLGNEFSAYVLGIEQIFLMNSTSCLPD